MRLHCDVAHFDPAQYLRKPIHSIGGTVQQITPCVSRPVRYNLLVVCRRTMQHRANVEHRQTRP